MSRIADALERSRHPDRWPRPSSGPPSEPFAQGPHGSGDLFPSERPPARHARSGFTGGRAARVQPEARRPATSLLIVLVFLGVAVIVASFASTITGPAAPPEGPIRVPGLISGNEVLVPATADGRITRLAVDEGDSVEPGTVIAVLQRDDLHAERTRQIARLAELQDRLNRSGDAGGLAARRADGAAVRAAAELEAARGVQQHAERELARVRREIRRTEGLATNQAAPPRELEALRLQESMAEARVRAAADRVAASAAGLRAGRAARAPAAAEAGDRGRIRDEIQEAEAELAAIDAQLSGAPVQATAAGTVSVRMAREGEIVARGDPIVALVDERNLWVRAPVDERRISHLAAGDVLQVEVPSGERRTGRITRVVPGDAGTATVFVALENADGRLRAGMRAQVVLPPARP